MQHLVELILNIFTTGFILYVIWGGLMTYKEFSSGDPERGKAKAFNMLIGIVIFGILVVTKDSIMQSVINTRELNLIEIDEQKLRSVFTDWIAPLLVGLSIGTIVTSLFGWIYVWISDKINKKVITHHVVPNITENGIEDGYFLIERQSSLVSLFGNKVKQEIKLRDFISMDEAVEALEEIQSTGRLKSAVAVKEEVVQPKEFLTSVIKNNPETQRAFRSPSY